MSAAAQIFWVVKNGINMTGMPSFGRVGADDKEIWSIAAFVKKLPSVSEGDYKSWTAAPRHLPQPRPPRRTGSVAQQSAIRPINKRERHHGQAIHQPAGDSTSIRAIRASSR